MYRKKIDGEYVNIFLFFLYTIQYVEVDISSLLLDVEIIKQEEREKLGPN